jgi:hypothetical protein
MTRKKRNPYLGWEILKMRVSKWREICFLRFDNTENRKLSKHCLIIAFSYWCFCSIWTGMRLPPTLFVFVLLWSSCRRLLMLWDKRKAEMGSDSWRGVREEWPEVCPAETYINHNPLHSRSRERPSSETKSLCSLQTPKVISYHPVQKRPLMYPTVSQMNSVHISPHLFNIRFDIILQ